MVELHTNLVATAFTWAHEVGHAINMQHDFKTFHPHVEKNDKDGHMCSNISGVMDYSRNQPTVWTSCSKDDLTRLYEHEMKHFNHFCLDQE